MNRKLLVFLGLVAALVVGAGALKTALAAAGREYQEAAQPPSPPVQSDSVAGEKLDAQNKAKVEVKPYEQAEYRRFPVVGSRVAIWAVAQLHLLFAAFVLAVPIFAFIVEAIGYKTGDKRYDRLAYEFTKLLSVSFSLTATFGAALTFMLIILYPKFTNYLMSVFSPTFLPYVLLFFFEAFFLYTYYYGWGKFHPLVHLGLGLGLNVVGTGIMLIANSWLTFMMSPRGVAADGAVISVWDAVNNFTWMPINVHRVIANVAFGGSIAAAYAAFKFLQAKTDEERAHYDWMGYIGNFVAISAFLPLPFAGYWLAKEIYAYSQTLGLTMMGGAFSWLFIIQAILIGNLFLAANYYLWLGMGRVEGRQPIQKVIKYLLITIAICFMVWATPRSIIATVAEIRSMGGSSHPVLGFLGVMSAKNTAVNILILTTFMSFLLYRRTGKIASVAWAKKGHAAQLAIFAAVAIFVIFLGVYGYFVEATVRIKLSVPQVLSVLIAMVSITAIDVFLFRGARMTGDVRWGRIPAISQYVLIFIAVTFTWLMGLMGYVRSGLRQHWHVYGVIRDQSVDAFTPTLGFATKVVSATVLLFFLLIGFVFWLASLHDRPDFEERAARARRPGRGSAGARRGTFRADVGGPTAMRIPHIIRIGALILVTTGFYTYVGQMVPQKEVQPPKETALGADMSTADMAKIGREIMEGKGICLTCHTIGKSGALRFPDLAGIGARAGSRVPGLSDVEYLAQSLYEPFAFVVPGFPPAMPPVNQPPIGLTDQEILCVIAALQTLGGTPTVTMKTHAQVLRWQAQTQRGAACRGSREGLAAETWRDSPAGCRACSGGAVSPVAPAAAGGGER